MGALQLYSYADILSIALLAFICVYVIVRVVFINVRLSYQETVLLCVVGLITIYAKLTAFGALVDQFTMW